MGDAPHGQDLVLVPGCMCVEQLVLLSASHAPPQHSQAFSVRPGKPKDCRTPRLYAHLPNQMGKTGLQLWAFWSELVVLLQTPFYGRGCDSVGATL